MTDAELKVLKGILRQSFTKASFDQGDIPLLVERIIRDKMIPDSVLAIGSSHPAFDFAKTISALSDKKHGELYSQKIKAVRYEPYLLFAKHS